MITIQTLGKKDPLPLLMKVRDVAALLSLSSSTVRALLDSGDLEGSSVNPSACKQRDHKRITRQSLVKFYQKRFGQPLNRAMANPFED